MDKIGFLGAGKMAFALIKSIENSGISKSIIASDHTKERLDYVKSNSIAKTTLDNKEVIKNSDIIFICVKPQDIESLLDEIKSSINEKQIIVSIAAGIMLSTLESHLSGKKVVRVMPNTPALVGEMAAGYCLGKKVSSEDAKKIEKILSSSGKAFLIEEKIMDALTAVSGSGPAFFALFIEAMVEAGKKEGLDEKMAFTLACQTAIGTGKLMIENNLTPRELISMVASKGGTTEAGLKALEEGKAKEAIGNAIKAAAKRSRELGKK